MAFLHAIIVEDYDDAIAFSQALGFELAEDSPARTNDGRPKSWVVVRPSVRPGDTAHYAWRAQRAMGNARLVVVAGHGHHFRSACVQHLRERYLVDLHLPPRHHLATPTGHRSPADTGNKRRARRASSV